MTTAFISYSHKDETFRQELETHLAPLRRQHLIDVWHDRKIPAGDHLDDTISAHLESADLVLMLISADFVASDYCYTKEMARALERHQAGEARALSIICRPCVFNDLSFARFLLLPTDGRAVSSWLDRDAAWVDVVKGIRGSLAAPAPREIARIPAPASSPIASASHSSPRTSLKLPKSFTDLDKRDFLESAFERIWRVFQGNATELQSHNAGVEARLKRIDAQAFALRIFVNGRELGGGSVYYGGGGFGGNQICFSQSPDAPRNSMNDWFSVEATEDGLYLKESGMRRHTGGQSEGLVDPETAASSLWDDIIDQVKARIR